MLRLALMAARLAAIRGGSNCCFTYEGQLRWCGLEREFLKREGPRKAAQSYPGSVEYYQMIDRIARGEKP